MRAAARTNVIAHGERPRILFLVNGGQDSAMGIRAASFAERLGEHFSITLAYRTGGKLRSMVRMLRTARRLHPHLCYVFDAAYSGVGAALAVRLLARTPFVIDTGDAIYELARATGSRGIAGLALTRLLEQTALHLSERVVVRSSVHRDELAARGIPVTCIPDGVDTAQFTPHPEPGLRRELELEGVLTVGLIGTLTWNHRRATCYGMELVEAIRLLRDAPIKGIIIGDGDGLPRLREFCASHGLKDRVRFTGRLPYTELPRYLNVMDLCLSTQTNDSVGRVRTTGKLPLYLATGRFVLASQVGEAERVLPPVMLVPYQGSYDPAYPARLAARIRQLLAEPTLLSATRATHPVVATTYDYNVLSGHLGQLLSVCLSHKHQ